jgi:signal transduction histidine kinase
VIPSSVLVALTVAGLSLAVSGALIIVHRAVVSGCLLMVGGAAATAGAVLEATDHPDLARLTLTAGGALALPLTLATYPRLMWRHPVNLVALASVGGAGTLATARWSDVGTVAVLGLVTGLVLVAQTWWRIERSPVGERWALTWMSLSIGAYALLGFLVVFAFPSTATAVIAVAALGLLGPALYAGVARPDVVDVRGWVVRIVVFAVAAIVYVSVFVTLASLFEIVAGTGPEGGVLAIIGLVAAVALHPTRVVLQGVIDELLFGRRSDPLGAARHVAGHVGDDPAVALRAIREALALPYAALAVDGARLAESGTPVTQTRTLPLDLGEGLPADRLLGDERADTQPRGELVIGLRAADLRLSPGDEHVLRLVAPLLAQTVRANALAGEVQRSREATITAVEEERRRLRRDLHDELGPRLSGIAFTADAARNSLRSDPAGAQALLVALRAETVTAIDDIRRLVYAMRPPALDELGLVPALRQQAATLRAGSGQPLRVTIAADELPPDLPAAVEVAAYRIVMEGLTNVARHSGSHRAEVRLLVADHRLVLEVIDRGVSAHWSPGVGIVSMRERARELGGTLTATGSDSGGLVRAVLPLSAAGDHPAGPA